MANFDIKGGRGLRRLCTQCMRWYISSQKPVAKLTGLISDLDMDDYWVTAAVCACRTSRGSRRCRTFANLPEPQGFYAGRARVPLQSVFRWTETVQRPPGFNRDWTETVNRDHFKTCTRNTLGWWLSWEINRDRTETARF